MVELRRFIRRTIQMLRADPRFAFAVIGTLALGIGINTAMFSVVNGILLRPLPFRDADRIVSLAESNARHGWSEAPLSVPDFHDWGAQSKQVRPMAAFQARSVMLGDPSGQDIVQAAAASASLFTILGANPVVGRGFAADEDNVGAPCVVVLSHQLWTTRFGSDRGIVGKPLSVDDRACTVIGVVPNIDLPNLSAPAIWLPFGMSLERWQQAGLATKRGQRLLPVIGKLAPGATVDQARAEMSALAARLASTYPATNEGFGAAVVPLKDRVLGNSRRALLMLFGAVGFVLLIGCANVANLLLARGAARRHEFALRLALGADQSRLVRQLLAENLTFSLLGGSCGLAVAHWMLELLRVVAPHSLPRLESVSIDMTAVVFHSSNMCSHCIGFRLRAGARRHSSFRTTEP